MGATLQWRELPERDDRAFGGRIDFGRGRASCAGYLAHSDRVGPGVLLLHEFFGLQPGLERVADYLNLCGFTVLAPDFYDGAIAGSVEEAEAMMNGLDDTVVSRRLEAARDFLIENWHPRLGIVGFSMGANLAARLAGSDPPDALVFYYGLGELNTNVSSPLLGHFAAEDEWEDLTEVRRVFEAREDAGFDAELNVYDGVGHWFVNPDVSDSFDAAATKRAHERTVEFLTYHLS